MTHVDHIMTQVDHTMTHVGHIMTLVDHIMTHDGYINLLISVNLSLKQCHIMTHVHHI